MRSTSGFIALLLLLSGMVSCQKVIDININDSNTQYIVEGEITDAPGPYQIKISLSKNFDEDNNFPPVMDALVYITDETTGYTDTLSPLGAGRYQTTNLQGVAEHRYKLSIAVEDKMLTSVATIPAQTVMIDSLYLRKSDFGDETYFIVPVYTDPPGKGNRYLIRQYINGQVVKGSRARSDEVTDGAVSEFPLWYNTSDEADNPLINNGDSVKVELLSIPQEVYDFYRTLETTIDQNAAAPANPLSNVQGAIGVFNAATIHSRTIKATF